MAMSLYYYSGNCSSPKTQAQIKQNFITILDGSFFNSFCREPVYKDKCKAENVKVTCSAVSGNGRKKRASGRLLRNYFYFVEYFQVSPCTVTSDDLKLRKVYHKNTSAA